MALSGTLLPSISTFASDADVKHKAMTGPGTASLVSIKQVTVTDPLTRTFASEIPPLVRLCHRRLIVIPLAALPRQGREPFRRGEPFTIKYLTLFTECIKLLLRCGYSFIGGNVKTMQRERVF